MLDKPQKRICKTIATSLVVSLESFTHRQNIANLSLFYNYYFSKSSSEQVQQALLSYSWDSLTRFSDRLEDFSAITARRYKDAYVTVSFVAQLDSRTLCPYNIFPWTMILIALALELTDIFYL